MPTTEPDLVPLDQAVVAPQVMVGANLPLWTQNGSYGAVVDRALIENAFGAGVRRWGGLLTAPRAAGANMSVDVGQGDCIILGSDTANQGAYLCRSTATNNIVLNAAPAAGTSRIDRIIARVYDTAVIGGSINAWQIEVVTGVASASPALPALPASSIPLARVTVAAGTASITAGLITDDRSPSAPGTMGNWWQYTPVWTTTTGSPSLGNGTLLGRYLRIGTQAWAFKVFWQMGSTTTNGVDFFYFSLPPGIQVEASLTSNGVLGSALITSRGSQYNGLAVQNNPGDQRIRLLCPQSATNNVMGNVASCTGGPTVGTGCPNVPGQFSFMAGDIIFISGVFESY